MDERRRAPATWKSADKMATSAALDTSMATRVNGSMVRRQRASVSLVPCRPPVRNLTFPISPVNLAYYPWGHVHAPCFLDCSIVPSHPWRFCPAVHYVLRGGSSRPQDR